MPKPRHSRSFLSALTGWASFGQNGMYAGRVNGNDGTGCKWDYAKNVSKKLGLIAVKQETRSPKRARILPKTESATSAAKASSDINADTVRHFLDHCTMKEINKVQCMAAEAMKKRLDDLAEC